jgi:DNA-binding beta-propeller fold protein YncE
VAVAIDAGGNAWVANKSGSAVSAFTLSGATVSGSPFAGAGTISTPTSIAIDAPGNVWVANSGNSSVTQLTSAGTYVQQVTSGISNPQSLAINPK